MMRATRRCEYARARPAFRNCVESANVITPHIATQSVASTRGKCQGLASGGRLRNVVHKQRGY
jgi:hypothetical protein